MDKQQQAAAITAEMQALRISVQGGGRQPDPEVVQITLADDQFKHLPMLAERGFVVTRDAPTAKVLRWG